MKSGKDLVDLAVELKRRAESKEDYIVAAPAMRMTPAVTMQLPAHTISHLMTPLAHGQLSQWLGIPKVYYDRMRSTAPSLLAENVNTWMGKSEDRRMIRILDSEVRAVLSDRYRRLDNDDVAEAALPILLNNPDIQVVSCDVTDTRLYLKAVFPRVEAEVTVGDIVQAGVVISNSEVGLGALAVEPLVFRLRCSNGMIAKDEAWRKYHVGRRAAEVEDISIYREQTLVADDRAMLMRLQDAVRAASAQTFTALVSRMRAATEGPQVQKPTVAIEKLGKTIGLLQSEQDSVLELLIRNQDYSRWGVLNAVTATAELVDSYDRATELEALGGRVLDLSKSEWAVIAEAA